MSRGMKSWNLIPGPARMVPVKGWTRYVVLLPALLYACTGSPPALSTTITAPSTTVPVTTLPPPLELTMQNCGAPTIDFSVLCEAVDLIETESIHQIGRSEMSAVATQAVRDFVVETGVERPRGLICAAPGEEFVPFCEALADQVEAESPPVADVVDAAVTAILSALPDPYNSYIPPELLGSIGDDGIVPGVGMVVNAINNAGSHCVRVAPSCPLRVVTVIPGSPAELAGVTDRAQITAIDGSQVEGKSVAEVASLLAGEPGTDVTVTIEGMDLVLTRGVDEVVPLTGELVGSTGYVRLPEFGFDSHILLHGYLQAFNAAGADRLVMDLRDNPGGYLFSASLVGSEFVGSGILYRTQERVGDFEFPAVEGGIGTGLPLILLVNENSASAAEILAAGLQERGRATVVGTRTFGKNFIQVPFETRAGGSIRLTVGTWTTPNGASVAETGVTPDISLTIDQPLSVPDLVAAVLAAL